MKTYIFRKSIILFAIAVSPLFNCFNHQDHQVTRPEVPRYVLTGTTIDYTTGLPLANVPLKITAGMLVYDVRFNSQILQSDSSGFFSISPVYPGNYTLYAQKNECWLQGTRLEIQHNDRDFVCKVPNVINANLHPSQIYTGSHLYPNANGFYRCFTITSLTGVIPVKLISADKISYYFGKVTLKNGFGKYSSLHETNSSLQNIYQLALGDEKFWGCKKPDSILVFDQWQYTFLNKYSTNVFIKDIAYNVNDKNLYACTDSLLYQVDVKTYAMNEIAALPITGTIAMTWNDNYLYLLQGTEDLVYKLDNRLQIVDIFAIVDQTDNFQYTQLYDMNFDGYNNLWISVEG